MKSTTIKTNYETDVLFTGSVSGMGHVILVCSCINSKRVYARITGNIIQVHVNNGSSTKDNMRICTGSNFTIDYSSTIDDIDAIEFGSIDSDTLLIAHTAFEVR